ncbi:MAG: hypothetical protein AAF658_09350 [Myxococcota bacterium]
MSNLLETWLPGESLFEETESHYALRPMLNADSEIGWRQEPRPSTLPPTFPWSDGVPRLYQLPSTAAFTVDATPSRDFLELGHDRVVNATYADGHGESTKRELVDPLFEDIEEMRSTGFGTHREVQTAFWTGVLDR